MLPFEWLAGDSVIVKKCAPCLCLICLARPHMTIRWAQQARLQLQWGMLEGQTVICRLVCLLLLVLRGA